MSKERQINWKVYIVAHEQLYDDMYLGDPKFDEKHYEVLNVGAKGRILNTGKLSTVDQKALENYESLGKWWAESEGIYNLWKSGCYKNLEYIGFIHYDLELRLEHPGMKWNKTNITQRITDYLNRHQRAHISFATFQPQEDYRQRILADVNQPNTLTGKGYNCYEYILDDYNKYFGTNYKKEDLFARKQINLCSCFLINTEEFDKMMQFWDWVVKSKKLEIFDTEHKYRLQGGLAERYFGVYLAFAYDKLLDLTLIHHYNDGLKEKPYCIVSRKDQKVGLFSFFNTTLGSVVYWTEKGYEVYVDDRNVHEWDRLFARPGRIPKERQEQKGFTSDELLDFRPDDSMEILTNQRLLAFWHSRYEEYFEFQPQVKTYLEGKMNAVIGDDRERTIGVLCRGTDYLSIKPKGHPRQPRPEELFPKIDQFMQEGNYTRIFLATEDPKVELSFKERYGEALRVNECEKLVPKEGEYLNHALKREEVSVFERNRDYLANIYMLSKCKAFVGGRTSGTVGAFVMSEGFERVFLWNDGRYQDELEHIQ